MFNFEHSFGTDLLAFSFGVSTFFLLFFSYAIHKNNHTKISIRPVIRRILVFAAIVIIGHSLLLFVAFFIFVQSKVQILKTYSGCFLSGFIFTLAPVTFIRRVNESLTEDFMKNFSTAFHFLNALKEIYYESIVNEIHYEVRLQSGQIVTAESENSHRAINKSYEENKTMIAIYYRDKIFKVAERAFNIFDVRNVQIKNGYLLHYFKFSKYKQLLEQINNHPPIQMNGWDCIERRKQDDSPARERRFHNQPSFKSRFLNLTLQDPSASAN